MNRWKKISLLLLGLSVALAAPCAAQEAGQLRVVKISGKAEILSASSWNAAQVGGQVAPNDRIRVVGKGEVAIASEDGKVHITARDNTIVVFDGRASVEMTPWKSSRLAKSPDFKLGETTAAQTRFFCPRGEVGVRVAPGEPLGIVTPLIAASVRGTSFDMKVEADASSSLRVGEGSVAAYNRLGQAALTFDGDEMAVTSREYVRHLRDHGWNIAENTDWRLLDPIALEELDDKLLGQYFTAATPAPVVSPVPQVMPAVPQSTGPANKFDRFLQNRVFGWIPSGSSAGGGRHSYGGVDGGGDGGSYGGSYGGGYGGGDDDGGGDDGGGGDGGGDGDD